MARRVLIVASMLALTLSLSPGGAVAQPAPDNENSTNPDVVSGDVVPPATMPFAVDAEQGIVPDVVTIETEEDEGTETYEAEAIQVDDLQTQVTGLLEGEHEEFELPEADDPGNPFDPNDPGVEVFTWTVPDEGAARMVADVRDTTSPDIDLYVGLGDALTRTS